METSSVLSTVFQLFGISHPYFSTRALQDRTWFSHTSYNRNHEQILWEHFTSRAFDNSPRIASHRFYSNDSLSYKLKLHIFPLPCEDKHVKEMNCTCFTHISSYLYVYLFFHCWLNSCLGLGPWQHWWNHGKNKGFLSAGLWVKCLFYFKYLYVVLLGFKWWTFRKKKMKNFFKKIK